MYATCETGGCSNAWQPIEVTGEAMVLCGVCLTPITLIEETAPVAPKEMPTWEIG